MKKFNTLLMLALASMVILGGCNNKPKEDPNKGSETPTTENPIEDNNPLEEEDRSKIGEEFKHDAYYYYGLNLEGEVEFLIEQKSQDMDEQDPKSGSQQVIYVGPQGDDGHLFRIVRTGGLSQLPTEELLLKKDGLYTVKTFNQELNPPQLAMPAKLDEGLTWETNHELSPAGTAVKLSYKNTVGAKSKKTVDGQEFDVISILASGTTTQGENVGKMKGESFFSKDQGIVSLELEVENADGSIVTSKTWRAKPGTSANPSPESN